MTIWRVGEIAMVIATTPEKAKRLVVEVTGNKDFLKAEIEIMRNRGPERILLLGEIPKVVRKLETVEEPEVAEKPKRKRK